MIRPAEKSDIKAIAGLEKKYVECAWSEEQLLSPFSSELYSFFVDEQDGIV